MNPAAVPADVVGVRATCSLLHIAHFDELCLKKHFQSIFSVLLWATYYIIAVLLTTTG